MINRRKFFRRSVLAAGGVAAFPHVARSSEAIAQTPGQKPGRIVHLVSDGTSLGTITAGDYLARKLRGRGLVWIDLLQNPGARRGLMNMRSLNSMVTDSSAASSSWGSGSRVTNGAMNYLPSGKNLTPLYSLFDQRGWKRGLVTTTEITHATPGGFAASVNTRDDAPVIAAQYLERRVDVLLGGGRTYFEPAGRKDKRDLKAEFNAAGYRVLLSASELGTAPDDQRWLGVFSTNHLPFSIDWLADPLLQARVPSLSAMTRRALQWLGRHDHFILQIEGGRVDHGAHNCDAPAALHDLLAFDDALEVVLEFRRQQPDTLIVVTTDHGTGNMGVNGSGTGYGHSSQMFQRVAEVKCSFPEILRQLRQAPPSASTLVPADEQKEAATKTAEYVPSVKDIRQIIAATTGYKVSEHRAALFQAFLAKKDPPIYDLMNSETAQLGQLLANHIAVGWASGAHTADYVPIAAMGPGAERFEGFIQNTDVFRNYTQLAGIDFKNPEEPLIAAAGPEAGDVERVAEYALA